ncbi:MAG: excinuclease ABC subunit UvrB [Candidatus Moranbacteria bacterium]|nr:excinuclease ABC subunit UvrB [Candidatus Moranbacteria bacterium]
MSFQVKSQYQPKGDQPKAIQELTRSIKAQNQYQTLLGVTGSGKTFTVAKVIEKINRPALVIAHNKTLAAQLVQEFRDFFPNNAVEYFVSYYDYYQPEAYIPTSDTYIEKDASINAEIERMRSSATESLLSRQDVIIVASVSCIYGLGNPETYEAAALSLKVNDPQIRSRKQLVENLIDIGFTRSEDPENGTFRIRGASVEVISPHKDILHRIEFQTNRIKSIKKYDSISHQPLKTQNQISVFPAKHFVLSDSDLNYAIPKILKEMRSRVKYFLRKNLYLEAERLERRVTQDMAMLKQVGYVSGIENYSRYLTRRKSGDPPYTLIDYFKNNFVTVIDESHVTIPQLQGMFASDQSRKDNLIKYGFRLPSARDNRPLKFQEFLTKTNQLLFTSATPGIFEKKHSQIISEQIIRPTGLVDPKIIIRNSQNQILDLIQEVKRIAAQEKPNRSSRILVTTLTKKTAEDLSQYLKENQIKAKYLHSEVNTLDRIRLLSQLRQGKYQVLVGVNLLREGLDLPEVSLVAILDADREGFLRNQTSLIQTMGRAARNIQGRVILYREKMTRSLKKAIRESNRRRQIQLAYNQKHNIKPQSIQKQIKSIAPDTKPEDVKKLPQEFTRLSNASDLKTQIRAKQQEMKALAQNLEFEKAALIRDEINILKKLAL